VADTQVMSASATEPPCEGAETENGHASADRSYVPGMAQTTTQAPHSPDAQKRFEDGKTYSVRGVSRVLEYKSDKVVRHAIRTGREPLRECCRLQSLRGWSHVRDIEEVFAGGS